MYKQRPQKYSRNVQILSKKQGLIGHNNYIEKSPVPNCYIVFEPKGISGSKYW